MLAQPVILVATDFSASSDFALKAAEKIRLKAGGRIHVIHVSLYPGQWDWFTNDVVLNYYPEEFKKELIDSLAQKLHRQIKDCGAQATGEVIMGPVAKSILEFASTYHPDLIIMGHKGKETHFHLGDIAAKVVAASDRPVLVVNKEFDVEKVAGLVDPFHPEKKVFSAAEELGFICSGEVEFVSLWPDQAVYVEESFPEGGVSVVRMTEEKKREVKSRMEKILRDQTDPHSRAEIRAEVAEEDRIRDGLVRVLDEDKIDLAVMSRHHKGRLEKILLGSVTRGVLDHWHGNLMVLPS